MDEDKLRDRLLFVGRGPFQLALGFRVQAQLHAITFQLGRLWHRSSYLPVAEDVYVNLEYVARNRAAMNRRPHKTPIIFADGILAAAQITNQWLVAL
jgi:hypothetical protein